MDRLLDLVGALAAYIPHLRGLGAWLVRAVANTTLPASLIYFVVLDAYGVLLLSGLLEPAPVASSLLALLGIYFVLILILGAVWSHQAIRVRQLNHLWEKLTDVRGTRWIDVLGLALVLVIYLALFQRFIGFYRATVLFGVLAGLPLLAGTLQRRRWHVVEPGQQDLFKIAASLAPNYQPGPNEPKAKDEAVAKKIYIYSIWLQDEVNQSRKPFDRNHELLRCLPVGLSLRLPPDL